MSRENVELVKRLYDAWEKDGFGVVPALMDPDIEYVNPPYAVEPGTRRGYDGFAIAAEAIRAVYPTRRFEPLAFYAARDRVAVRVKVVARGVGSSVEVDAERGYVFDVRDGKVIRFAWFNESLEALRAVGLKG
jgi:ketosteroid isomerase-like protein